MDTLGIIAEYNPFHNGHLYQIKQIKKMTGAKSIVAVMSGDFVQRGTPAWTDKYLRTQMALSQGIDMVFELPVTFSASSAESFARAGISLLTTLGFIDGVCFGTECGNLPLLQEIAAFLSNPPDSFDETIQNLTARGLSYPAARQRALDTFWSEPAKEYPNIFSDSNNILALEYLKAIVQLKSPLIPFLILRQGNSYHDTSLSGSFPSASAIRKSSTAITAANSFSQNAKCTSKHQSFLNAVNTALPAHVFALLQEHTDRYPITEDYFSDLLYYRLLHLSKMDNTVLDMTEDIFHRIEKNLPDFESYSGFTAKVKTKQYTYSRISRVLLHCLLDITTTPAFMHSPQSAVPAVSPFPYVPYARLLGFRSEKSFLLRHKSSIPVITKPADGLSKIHAFYHSLADSSLILPMQHINNYIDYACVLYEKDIFASNLYRQVQCNTLGCSRPNEYYCQPVILD